MDNIKTQKIREDFKITTEALNEYYMRIYLRDHGGYEVYNLKNKYLGYVKNLPEALYYRDQYQHLDSKTAPRPNEVNLKRNNPYLINGLKYPIPVRLDKEKKHKRHYDKGCITKANKSSYKVQHGKHICSCRTYEQAYYVRQELNKCNWDTSKLPEILDKYPEYYTKLLYFYQYISYNHDKKIYILNIPKKYNDGKLLRITYHDVEEALWERDFLADHNWNYDLLVEAIDDTKNPYYSMDLPPYPERKIRNISSQSKYDRRILLMHKYIREDPSIHQNEIAEKIGVTTSTVRSCLKKYNTDWLDFKIICMRNDNPLDVLVKSPKIYQPNLEPSKPVHFTNYVYVDHNRKSKYRIKRQHESYGSYPTREIALKVSKYLQKYNWDKSRLPDIYKKIGFQPRRNMNNIYPYRKRYVIRKKFNKKLFGFGVYSNYETAKVARSLWDYYQWDTNYIPHVQEEADYIKSVMNILPYTMRESVRL